MLPELETPIAPWLWEIGLDQRSILTYLELARVGEQPVSIIARRLNMKRTTMYYLLDRLAEIGVVSWRTHQYVRLYRAERPGAVLKVLRSARKRLSQGERSFMELCKSIKS